jgi:hypothetical protein
MRPEIDLPLWMAANAAPYLAWASVLALRCHGLRRRWALAGGAVLYALVVVLWPVGEVMRAREGWLFYTVAFIVLGFATWIALPLLWFTWLAWSGRIFRWLPRESEVTGTWLAPGGATREATPITLFTVAWIPAISPWLWPLSAIPVIGPYIWIPYAASFLGLVTLIVAVRISDRRPGFLVPRDLRDEPAARGVGDEWPFGFSVVVATIIIGLTAAIGLLLGSTSGPSSVSLRVLALPLVLVVCLAVMVLAARYHSRRGRPR